MKEFMIITRCGVTLFREGVSSHSVAEEVRSEGWAIFVISAVL